MSTITMERRREIIREAEALIKQGRKQEGRDLVLRLTPMNPVLANDFKRWLKVSPKQMLDEGFNLDDAVAVYGEQWLESYG